MKIENSPIMGTVSSLARSDVRLTPKSVYEGDPARLLYMMQYSVWSKVSSAVTPNASES